MSDGAGEAVIVGAEVAAGHDGAAELVVRLRYANGAEASVSIDAEAGFELMKNCGVADVAGLAGQPWRRLLKGDGPCSTS
jgi:hypothetical protein